MNVYCREIFIYIVIIFRLLLLSFSLYFPRTYIILIPNESSLEKTCLYFAQLFTLFLTYVIEILEKMMITQTHPTQTININF